ncbi:MAG: hypothetical protein OXP73_14150 [Chloroflexota bacterium]|nr:hypothetical protein [Chloroflexota bacterium]
MTESQALQRSRHSDPEAFRQLVDRHQDVLFRTATLMTGSQSVAEARVREVLRMAWHGLWAAGPAPVRPRLMRTLVRQETDRGSPSTPSVRPLYRARLRQIPPSPDPGETDPQRHQLRRAFGALGPVDRHALILSYFANLSDPQLAVVLGLREGAAESMRHRALRRLRSRLQAIGAQAVDGAGPFASDQELIVALGDYFNSVTAALAVPADLWDVLESRAPNRSRVARIRRRFQAAAQRFWTPLAATGGAAALASAVVCAATA